MTGRDRLVVIGIIALAILAGGWLLAVSPERKKASEAEAQVATARAQLQSAQQDAASARTAQARYQSAYASVVNLGKAIPPQQEVPALVYELDQASHQRDVNFNSISSGGAGSSSSSSSSPAGASAAAALTPAAFTQMPFTFVFKGSYFGLARLLGEIDGFAQTTSASGGSAGGGDATVSATGGVRVDGRLLTIQGVALTLENQAGPTTGSKAGELSATITATAYVLPASEGLTAGATPAGPAGATTSSAASSASATGSSSPTSAAVIQGGP